MLEHRDYAFTKFLPSGWEQSDSSFRGGQGCLNSSDDLDRSK